MDISSLIMSMISKILEQIISQAFTGQNIGNIFGNLGQLPGMPPIGGLGGTAAPSTSANPLDSAFMPKMPKIEQFPCGTPLINPSAPLNLQYVAPKSLKVVGGDEATAHSWPWTLGLVRDGKMQCGAALIDPEFAVTAAHCVSKYRDARRYQLILRSHTALSGERIAVKRIRVHPLWLKVPANTWAYDIALLQLIRRITLDEKAITVCLPTIVPVPNTVCVATGWGTLNESRSGHSQVLMEVALPVVGPGVCNDFKHYKGRVYPATMMCAGYDNGGPDTCQGDSGGPLVCKVGGAWQIHGIVSWGDGCGRKNRPGVYTKVLTFVGWLRAEMMRFRTKP